MVSGYFFSHDPINAPLSPLLGHDVKRDSVSWMQGAGGIVSSMQDVSRWACALYEGAAPGRQATRRAHDGRLRQDGRAVQGPSTKHPGTFGLGVGAGFRPTMGTYWYYQGMTLGYRVLYAYFPENGAVIIVGLNSQPDDKQNHNGALMEQIYGILQRAGKT